MGPPLLARKLVVFGMLGAWLGASCGRDPLHDRDVEALGPEDPSVEPGPLHRRGQPCSVCHGGDGPAKSTFVLSGTVYAIAGADDALPGATVRYIDWVGAQGSIVTNCAGNFFLRADEAAPRWPIWLRLQQGEMVADMQSAVFREGSCNACHTAVASPRTTGRVYLSEQPFAALDAGCP